MASYLITGGCGFIGSHLADMLVARGHRVTIIDDLSTGRIENAPEQATLLVGNVVDQDLVGHAMQDVDGCFHLAAIASTQRANEAWLDTHRSNLSGTVCVLDAARARKLPVVFASSAAVYGEQAVVPIREDALVYPVSAYGADKLGSELHARVAGLVHSIPTVGLRFFNVYGPRQDPRSPYSGVISIFVDRLSRGVAIDVHGDGRQVRDFVFVGDVVQFLVAAMEHADTAPTVYNVCTGRATSIRTLAHTLGQLLGKDVRLQFSTKRAGDIRQSLGCPEQAATQLGLRARVGLTEGLRRTIGHAAAPREAA